jgi:hypothetical protein
MTYPNGVASSHRFPANLNFRKALGLNRANPHPFPVSPEVFFQVGLNIDQDVHAGASMELTRTSFLFTNS